MTFKSDVLKRMIYNERRFKAMDVAEDENESVYIFKKKEIYDEINKLITKSVKNWQII